MGGYENIDIKYNSGSNVTDYKYYEEQCLENWNRRAFGFSEDLKTLLEKATEYATDKFGKKPSYVEIEEDGRIRAKYSQYIGCGEYEDDSKYFLPEEIN
jgi:hypothetical protein